MGAVILMTLAACGGFAAGASIARSHEGAAANGVAASMEGAPLATMSVRIRNYAFHPAAVIVEAGRTVT